MGARTATSHACRVVVGMRVVARAGRSESGRTARTMLRRGWRRRARDERAMFVLCSDFRKSDAGASSRGRPARQVVHRPHARCCRLRRRGTVSTRGAPFTQTQHRSCVQIQRKSEKGYGLGGFSLATPTGWGRIATPPSGGVWQGGFFHDEDGWFSDETSRFRQVCSARIRFWTNRRVRSRGAWVVKRGPEHLRSGLPKSASARVGRGSPTALRGCGGPRRAPMSLKKWRRFGGSGRVQAGFRQRAGGEPSLGRVKACGGGRSRAGLRDCAHQSRVKPRSGSRETEG
jgi:hypothetical protein